jgi:hypothetical protein
MGDHLIAYLLLQNLAARLVHCKKVTTMRHRVALGLVKPDLNRPTYPARDPAGSHW